MYWYCFGILRVRNALAALGGRSTRATNYRANSFSSFRREESKFIVLLAARLLSPAVAEL